MQTTSFKIWTQVAKSTSDDSNSHIMCASISKYLESKDYCKISFFVHIFCHFKEDGYIQLTSESCPNLNVQYRGKTAGGISTMPPLCYLYSKVIITLEIQS